MHVVDRQIISTSRILSDAKFFFQQNVFNRLLLFKQTKTPQQGQGVFNNTLNCKT